uniref:G_PROTEIN_RECEP_F1_2 domain-containing protein n=1 Tax=Meloidogyne hapla TaxID=6305 RepID=A0A1I8C3X9_MELHA
MAVLALNRFHAYKKILNSENRDNTTAEVDNANVVKDRLLILVICLISTTPCPLLVGIYVLFRPYLMVTSYSVDYPILYTIIYIIFNSNYLIIECIEEICLLIMSKEFRKLVKKQFIRNTQTNVVATIYVSQNSQQQRMRQLNGVSMRY